MEGKLSAQAVKKAISFYYLLAYCPAGKLDKFMSATEKMRGELAGEIGVSEQDVLGALLPEVGSRIISFHSALRQPDEALTARWAEAAGAALQDGAGLKAYQEVMAEVYALPGRAKPDNRLHRRKGCRFCEAPCGYGYFSLVSEPKFDLLQDLLNAEKAKPPQEKSAVRAAWAYAVAHIMYITGSAEGYIVAEHLGNLAYCLLMLSMAKSRYPLPEEQVKTFQERNQQWIEQF